mmetsp:Transcript_3360/g.5479  ORF Transcript_3360/g.5479 Transcript_3360/m.5479 type:complete len:132 (+) Transcript_3360:112-507(+)
MMLYVMCCCSDLALAFTALMVVVCEALDWANVFLLEYHPIMPSSVVLYLSSKKKKIVVGGVFPCSFFMPLGYLAAEECIKYSTGITLSTLFMLFHLQEQGRWLTFHYYFPADERCPSSIFLRTPLAVHPVF